MEIVTWINDLSFYNLYKLHPLKKMKSNDNPIEQWAVLFPVYSFQISFLNKKQSGVLGMISSRFGTGNEKDESGLSCYIREKEIIKVYLSGIRRTQTNLKMLPLAKDETIWTSKRIRRLQHINYAKIHDLKMVLENEKSL